MSTLNIAGHERRARGGARKAIEDAVSDAFVKAKDVLIVVFSISFWRIKQQRERLSRGKYQRDLQWFHSLRWPSYDPKMREICLQ